MTDPRSGKQIAPVGDEVFAALSVLFAYANGEVVDPTDGGSSSGGVGDTTGGALEGSSGPAGASSGGGGGGPRGGGGGGAEDFGDSYIPSEPGDDDIPF